MTKLGLNQGKRYGWRGAFIFPDDYFEVASLPPSGDLIIRLYNGRLTAGGALGDEVSSLVSGRWGFVETLDDPTLKLEDGRIRFARVA